MLTNEIQAVVLGSGPVGMVAALELSKHYRTALVTHHLPSVDDDARVEAVPASLLALLVEYGIHPGRIGVDRLHETRFIAWESETVTERLGPTAAHIERPALDLALLDALVASKRVKIISSRLSASRDAIAALQHRDLRMIDATGRRSVSATRRIRPARPWVARSFLSLRQSSSADTDFRIAAMPWGFVYRLGGSRHIVVGVVGPGKAVGETHLVLEQRLQEYGAEWILEGLPSFARMAEGRRAGASVQWTRSDSGIRIGDAALARDTLSSQGLASGISEALYANAIRNKDDETLFSLRQAEQRSLHLRSLAGLIETCRFREFAAWLEYSEFIAEHLDETRWASSAALREGRIRRLATDS